MRPSSLARACALLPLSLVGCAPDGPALPEGCDHYVTPSADDTQAVADAIVAVADGDVFCFGPGTYRFTDPVDFRDLRGLTVRGTGATRDAVVLDFSEETGGAKGLTFTAVDDLVVEDLTVLDAPGDNVFVTSGTGVTIQRVTSGWVSRPMSARGRYAIYPVESTDVLLDDVEAFGSSDAGLYVGQATNCVVRNSDAHDNVAGIEIENSTNCEVFGNHAHGNTGGILVFELPGLPMRGAGTLVHDNVVESNNLENFAEPGTIVSFLPAGTGMMLLAANDVEVRDNAVRDNASTGVFVLSYATAEVAGAPAADDPAYDGYSESIWLHDNAFASNGAMPASALLIITSALGLTTLEDMIWDGALGPGSADGTLCVGGEGSFRDADVPGNFMMSTTDRGAHACVGEPRAPVTL